MYSEQNLVTLPRLGVISKDSESLDTSADRRRPRWLEHGEDRWLIRGPGFRRLPVLVFPELSAEPQSRTAAEVTMYVSAYIDRTAGAGGRAEGGWVGTGPIGIQGGDARRSL